MPSPPLNFPGFTFVVEQNQMNDGNRPRRKKQAGWGEGGGWAALRVMIIIFETESEQEKHRK